MTYQPDNHQADTPGDSVDALFEQATLDALGILSDEEVALFEAALREAPEQLRRQLIRQHALSADLSDLLPDVEPPASLRDRVLRAVNAAIAESKGEAKVPHRAAAVAVSGARHRVLNARRVHSMWRSAAVGLAVAVVAISAILLQVQDDVRQGSELAEEAELFESIGFGYVEDVLVEDRTRRYFMTATAEAPASARASLLYFPEKDEARLYVSRLPADAKTIYRVVSTDGNGGNQVELARFTVDRPITSIKVPHFAEAMHIAIVVDRPGEDAPVSLFETSVRFVKSDGASGFTVAAL